MCFSTYICSKLFLEDSEDIIRDYIKIGYLESWMDLL